MSLVKKEEEKVGNNSNNPNKDDIVVIRSKIGMDASRNVVVSDVDDDGVDDDGVDDDDEVDVVKEVVKDLSLFILSLRNPKTINKFVIVNNDSAPPCNQSTLAKISWYATLAYIPAGIVAKTNTNKKRKPKLLRLGMLLLFRK